MSAASLAQRQSQPQAQVRRLIGAEFLKLRRRRSLLAASLALIVAPMLVSFLVLVVLHAANPAKYGPAGGVDNLRGALQLLVGSGSQVSIPTARSESQWSSRRSAGGSVSRFRHPPRR